MPCGNATLQSTAEFGETMVAAASPFEPPGPGWVAGAQVRFVRTAAYDSKTRLMKVSCLTAAATGIDTGRSLRRPAISKLAPVKPNPR